jgi:ferritin-like metal-binding protein YciE
MKLIHNKPSLPVFIPETIFGIKPTLGHVNLFSNNMEDIYWAEKALIKAIPEMIQNHTSEEAAIVLAGYFNLAVKHVKYFERILKLKKSGIKSKKIYIAEGILDEANEIIIKTGVEIPGLFM